MISEGSWWLYSESDSRWNCSGRSEYVGVGYTSSEASDKIAELTDIYGDPPKDLQFGCMKD